MKPETINRLIAEHCGWSEFREEEYPHRMVWREGEIGSRVWDEPPDYCADLNAMHEAESMLSEEELNYMVQLLYNLPGRFWRSTAAQRAEAFLKTIGKWEDG